MKGVIALCVKDLIVNKFGEEKWKEILVKAGIEKEPIILPISDLDDKTIVAIIEAIGTVLHLGQEQIADAFGDYWVSEYAPKIYSTYYRNVKNAREFLLKMDSVHETNTKKIANAHPPRFDYQWKDDRTLIMNYKSKRGLIDICVGLIKGVGRYFKEDLSVRKLDDHTIEIVFLAGK